MVNLFDNITDASRQKLLGTLEAEIRNYPKGSTLQSNILPKNYLIYVTKGLIEIEHSDYNGNTILIDEIEENMLFGNMVSTFISNEYEILVKENSQVIIIDFDIAVKVDINTQSYHTFTTNLMLIMSEKINRSNQRIEVLTNKTIRNKLLEYFKITAKGNNSKVVYLPFSYTTLANYLAVDRCAMSREISNMKEEGLIEVKGRRIKLLYYVN